VAEYPGGKPVLRILEYGGDEEAVTHSDAGYFVGGVAVTGRAANQLGAGRCGEGSGQHALDRSSGAQVRGMWHRRAAYWSTLVSGYLQSLNNYEEPGITSHDVKSDGLAFSA